MIKTGNEFREGIETHFVEKINIVMKGWDVKVKLFLDDQPFSA